MSKPGEPIEPYVISEIYSAKDWGSQQEATKARVARFRQLADRGYELQQDFGPMPDGEYPMTMVKTPLPTRIKPEMVSKPGEKR